MNALAIALWCVVAIQLIGLARVIRVVSKTTAVAGPKAAALMVSIIFNLFVIVTVIIAAVVVR